MTPRSTRLICSGCGWQPHNEAIAFRCGNVRPGDDVDHVMTVDLDTAGLTWPEEDASHHPFIRYRTLLSAYDLAVRRGMSDRDYVDLVERLDKEVAAVDGDGFHATPFGRSEALGAVLGFDAGDVWVKDETGNVSGSHKARHLMGVMIHLRVQEETGLGDPLHRPDLAIASCGNAALAAAVVARASSWPLRVFVPTWADPAVVERLRSLDAVVEVCERSAGVAGDPTYHALQRAIADGALPFTCQGNENGVAIEGGETLGYEIVDALRGSDAALDRVFIQVGGGALASAVVQAFAHAVALSALDGLPRIHAVQTAGGFPLKRAYDLVARREAASTRGDTLTYAAAHRSEFMWPWESEPTSVAHGILDDETYDWLAVVRGMMESGGSPVVVDEVTLVEANAVGRAATGVEVDHTGTAGLAGLLAMRNRGEVGSEERIAVLFTGARRETREERATA